MRYKGVGLFTAILCLASLPTYSQVTFFPLDEIRPGLVGVGKTVFQGTKVETFGVEVLGVLRNIGPKRNVILGKLTGEKVADVGVFAGMSGSPVYIDNKLVGAVALAFSFATEPIAGITPIQEMIDIFAERIPTSFTVGRKMSPTDIYGIVALPHLESFLENYGQGVSSHLGPPWEAGQLKPIATPVSFSGFSPRTLHDFEDRLIRMGFSPILGSGSARQDDWQDFPLEPGSTVSVQLVRGDMEVSASGTVTHIVGDKIYAFGHPFLSIGFTDLPLAKAAVLGVIPSLMSSQKISATTESIGAIKQDRAAGILGVLGEQSKLIPVNLKLSTSRNLVNDFAYEVVNDKFLTPFLISFSVHESIVSSERAIGGQTLQVRCKIALKDHPEVSFENSVSDVASSSALAAIAAASPVYFILNSGFENIVIEKIDLEIRAVEETREAYLEKVWQDKLEARPGEEVKITVFLHRGNGDVVAERYPVKIPEGLSPGKLKIMIGDGVSVTKTDAEIEEAEFIPETVSQLVRAINNLKKNDRLYIRLYRDRQGAIIAGQGLPGLPPSLLALYNSRKTSGDTQPIKRVVYVEHELPATDYVLTGQKVIEINIKG